MNTTSTPLTRRDRNKLRNRQEILAAARVVFAEKGYQQAGIQEIADRADFAVSTLYSLFDGKEALYRQVSIDVAKQAGSLFDAAMDQGKTPYEKLVQYVRAKGAILREMPEGCRMLEMEWRLLHSPQGGEIPKDGIGSIYRRFMGHIEALFTAGIQDGSFVDGDPALMAALLDSTANTLMTLARSDPEHYDYDQRVDEVIALFFSPVLRMSV